MLYILLEYDSILHISPSALWDSGFLYEVPLGLIMYQSLDLYWSQCLFFLTKDCTSKHSVICILSPRVKQYCILHFIGGIDFLKCPKMYWTNQIFFLSCLNYWICAFNLSCQGKERILLQLMKIFLFLSFFFSWLCILLVSSYKGNILHSFKENRNIEALTSPLPPSFKLKSQL